MNISISLTVARRSMFAHDVIRSRLWYMSTSRGICSMSKWVAATVGINVLGITLRASISATIDRIAERWIEK